MNGKTNHLRWLLCVSFLFGTIRTTAAGRVIYVDDYAVETNDGSSWANAFNYLQDAIAVARAGDEIRVAEGVYTPDKGSGIALGDRKATFQLINGVVIMGGYAGLNTLDSDVRDVEVYETILSGDLEDNDADVDVNNPYDYFYEPTRRDNSVNVVTSTADDASTVLDGFIVTGAVNGGMLIIDGSPTILNCIFSRNSASEGSGISIWQGQGLLKNCKFISNLGGGALFGMDIDLTLSECSFMGNYSGGAWILGNAVFTGCVFRNNSSQGGGGIEHSSGKLENGKLELTNCVFVDNSAVPFPKDRYSYGGAVRTTNATVRNCIFSGNWARHGGAIYGEVQSIENCTFFGNTAEQGGALRGMQGSMIRNSIFAGNRAEEGGVLFAAGSGSGPSLIGCTLSDNSAQNGNAISLSPGGRAPALLSMTISNCILWNGGNEIGTWREEFTDISITYSDIQGGWPGEGNIDTDPFFAQPGYWDLNGTADDPNDDFWIDGDYHLKSQAGRWEPVSESWVIDDITSPCIDAGNPNSPIAFEPFPNGGIINMGAYGGTVEASLSPSGIHAQFGGGTGEPNNPYQIATAKHLISIGADPNLLDKHFVLIADIDMDPNLPGGQIFSNSLICPYGQPPSGHGQWIPWENEPPNPNQFFGVFNGVLDGAGHVIRNLVINSELSNNLGLFGYIGETGIIRDLGIESVTILMNPPNIDMVSSRNPIQSNIGIAGGLAAFNYGKIIGCFTLGNISGAGRSGGLIAENYGLINNCYAAVDIRNAGLAGGFVAKNEGVVMFSYSTGALEGIDIVGGLIGENLYGYVYESYWDMDTCGKTDSAQGFGMNTSDLKDIKTYTKWEYTGTWILDNQNDYPRLIWEKTSGTMIGQGQAGYGGGKGDVNDPYLIGTKEQFMTIAYHPEDFDENFLLMADIDFNQVDCNYILPIGFNHIPFSGKFDGDSHILSNLIISRPDQNDIGIFGVVGAPNEFPYPENIQYSIKDNGIWSWGGAITFGGRSGHSVVPTGTIKNLYLDNVLMKGQTYVGGLVGFLSGTIFNCSVTGQVSGQASVGGIAGRSIGGTVDYCRAYVDVMGEFCTGGLLGLSSGVNVTDCLTTGYTDGQLMTSGLIGFSISDSISRCTSTVSVAGRYRTGGCIGESRSSTIIQCCSNSSVIAEYDVGGFIGAARKQTTLKDCYSQGSVTGTRYIGGFVGQTYNEHISRCYAASLVILIEESNPRADCSSETKTIGGFVGSSVKTSSECEGDCPMDMSRCFWDIDVSGLTNAIGNRTPNPESIIGKTTTEMQTIGTFLDAGWDFVDETANGTEDIWWILEGQDYPRLWWETTENPMLNN